MTSIQVFLEEYASLILSKNIKNIEALLDLDNVELVNTSEVLNKKDYLFHLDSKFNLAKIKLERVSDYQKDGQDKGLIIYTINGKENYKVVSFASIKDEKIIKIEDYWFSIF